MGIRPADVPDRVVAHRAEIGVGPGSVPTQTSSKPAKAGRIRRICTQCPPSEVATITFKQNPAPQPPADPVLNIRPAPPGRARTAGAAGADQKPEQHVRREASTGKPAR